MIHSYKPLPEGVTIKNSEIDGLGCFATKHISAGSKIAISHYFTEEFGILRSPVGSMLNHSVAPNTFVVREGNVLNLFAADDIAPNEELTLDYRTSPCCTEDDGDADNITFV